jgi:hypothetical protein
MAAGTSSTRTSQAGIRFDLSVHPDVRVLSFTLSRMAGELDDMSMLFESLGEAFKRSMTKQFDSQGSWGSGGWAPLSPAYRAWKLAHGYPGVIGVRTGALKAAMTGGEGYTQAITKHTASFGLGGGPAAEYGHFFDKVRPVIRLPRSQAPAWGKIAHQWMATEARTAGWGRV